MLSLTASDLTKADGTRVSLSQLNFNSPLSDKNEAEVFQAIISASEAGLERYPTTEDQDTDLMNDRSMFKVLPMNARNAIRLRRTEKRLLKRTIATADRRLVELRTGVKQEETPIWLQAPKRFNFPIDELVPSLW